MIDLSLPQGFAALAAGRRSIRRYQDRPVPPDILESLLEAATWAPSPHNRQPWRFALITESAAKERLARAMGDRLRADRLADGDDANDVAGDVDRSFLRITGAPAVIACFLTLEDMDVYPDERRGRAEYLMAVQAVALAVENILLAAAAAALGACWLCAPLFCSDTVVEALGLPGHWQAQALITLGYPDSRGKPARRRPLGDVVVSLPS